MLLHIPAPLLSSVDFGVCRTGLAVQDGAFAGALAAQGQAIPVCRLALPGSAPGGPGLVSGGLGPQ